MALPSISIKIVESNSAIQARILEALAKEIVRKTELVDFAITSRIGSLLQREIRNSSVWRAIESGDLRGDLGIPLSSDIDEIVSIWSNSVRLRLFGSRRADKIRLVITAVRADFRDVLNRPSSQYISAPSNELITWLEWVLLAGGISVIDDYRVDRNLTPNEVAKSRTGQALMKFSRGAVFRIQDFAQGTIDNNFVTRAIDGAHDKIRQIIAEEYNR